MGEMIQLAFCAPCFLHEKGGGDTLRFIVSFFFFVVVVVFFLGIKASTSLSLFNLAFSSINRSMFFGRMHIVRSNQRDIRT
jgi:hypothetical protein